MGNLKFRHEEYYVPHITARESPPRLLSKLSNTYYYVNILRRLLIDKQIGRIGFE